MKPGKQQKNKLRSSTKRKHKELKNFEAEEYNDYMQNSIDSFKSRLDQVEETINKPQNRSFEIIQPEEQKQKKKKGQEERDKGLIKHQ